jgi:uncharacterized membrane protein
MGVLLVGIILLSIVGALFTNSLMLMIAISTMAALIMVSIFRRESIPSKFYPFIILTIAISLLFQKEFISKYLFGWDVFGEYYVFRLVRNDLLWTTDISSPIPEINNYNSMLSVTVLPSIYSILLDIPGEWIFKFIYCLFFSLVPVLLFRAYDLRFGKQIALLSTFYFVLFPRFYNLAARKQWIAELFLASLILLMTNKSMNSRIRQILSAIFGSALVVSHYSISYFYLFLVCFIWFSRSFIERFSKIQLDLRKTITRNHIILLVTITLSWAILISDYPLRSLYDLAVKMMNSFFVDFFNPETRGMISEVVNPNYASGSIYKLVDFVINKFSYVFILIGIIAFFRKYKQEEFEWEYGLMSLASGLIAFFSVIVPFFAPAFLADRLYHVTLFQLAPFCILGGETAFDWIKRIYDHIFAKQNMNGKNLSAKSLRFVCVFLLVIFLFKVGFIYELAGDDPTSISISYMRMKTSENSEIQLAFYNGLVPEQDVFSAIWLFRMATNRSRVYADLIASKQVLRGYGMSIAKWKYYLTNNTIFEPQAYIYLRYVNVQGIYIDKADANARILKSTDFYAELNNTNKIFSNGYSEIYRSAPASLS